MLVSVLAFVLLQAAALPSGETASPGALAQAAQLLAAGHAAEAQAAYEAILTSSPSDLQAADGEVRSSEQLALEARSRNDMNSALGNLLQAKKFVPDHPRLLYDLGVLEDQIGLYRDADATVQHLQQLTPTDSKVDYLLARLKLDLGQLTESEAAMRKYLLVHPDDASAHYGLGRVLQLREDDEHAKAEFDRSIQIKPDQTESQYQLADIALKQGEYQLSIAEAAKVLARNPHHGGALTDTGIAWFQQKQFDQAAAFLNRAVTDAPAYQPAHYYLGLTLARLGRKEDSERELALATKLAAEDNTKSAQRLHLNQ